jgi:hypothetical protein
MDLPPFRLPFIAASFGWMPVRSLGFADSHRSCPEAAIRSAPDFKGLRAFARPASELGR